MEVSGNEKMDVVPFALYESMITHKDNKIQELHNELYERLSDERNNFTADLTRAREDFASTLDSTNESCERAVKRWQRACIAISLVLLVFVGGLFGTVAYIYTDFMSNYDLEFGTYEQDGDGMNNVNTGSQGDVVNGTEGNLG